LIRFDETTLNLECLLVAHLSFHLLVVLLPARPNTVEFFLPGRRAAAAAETKEEVVEATVMTAT
jgi:hypothetical protein